MGCAHSSEASVPVCSVRVITINGHLEIFDRPVTAGEITANSATYVLCSAAQLLSPGSRPLGPDDRLEPGRLYFLVPPSVLQAAPLDMAAIATRLTTLARSASAGKSKAASAGPATKVKERKAQPPWRPELSTVRELPSTSLSSSQSVQSHVKS
ncbi:hypothetical protein KSP39_PZI001697 [Platanthera zijinensis]|uniref:Uncharacterized protein n=1 Tax=Platanthera zijinensis TaxID=2320716 RepID=A0AAP0C1D1_9ASPA